MPLKIQIVLEVVKKHLILSKKNQFRYLYKSFGVERTLVNLWLLLVRQTEKSEFFLPREKALGTRLLKSSLCPVIN